MANNFNYIGGVIRWVYGTIWRTIAKKPKFKFKEYINGTEKSEDFFDASHSFANSIIGFLFVILTIIILANVL